MHTLYLGIGSNLGDRHKNIEQAIALIEIHIGKVIRVADIIETEPWGYQSPHGFLNTVIEVYTEDHPQKILDSILSIEIEIGRTKKTIHGIYQDRLIDIDLLLYDHSIIQTQNLTIPHPMMHKRLFVMMPLAQLIPNYIHPILHKEVLDICKELQ